MRMLNGHVHMGITISGVVVLKNKTAIFLLSLLTLLASLLSGCSGKISAGAQVYSIPKNGIVSKADLQKIAKSGGLAIYKGSDNGTDYEWTFVGPDIKDPADTNLGVSFKPADAAAMQQADGKKTVAFSIAQHGALPGKPALSISVGDSWSYSTYSLYSYDSSAQKATPAGTVSVVNGHATLTPAGGGEYFFTGNNAGSTALTSSSPAMTSSGSALADSSSAFSGISSQKPQSSSKSNSTGTSKPNQTSSRMQTGGGTGSSATSSNSSQTGGGSGSSAPAPVPNPPKPNPSKTIQVTITIRCDTAVANWANLKPNKQDHSVVPADGCILPVTTVTVNQGETVYDLLVKVCEDHRIQMEHKGYAIYNSEYIQGINNLYEFDGGSLSGWMYCVNGWYPNYGVSQYVLKNGDAVQFNYTCDLGRDLPGADSAMG